MDREQLLSLAERVEAAERPSRHLDALIEVELRRQQAYAVGLSDQNRAYWKADSNGQVYDTHTRYTSKRFTASLDAAMTLVPEGWHVLLERWSDGRGRAEASTAGQTIGLWAATPALALTASALRALAHVKEEG